MTPPGKNPADDRFSGDRKTRQKNLKISAKKRPRF
jgi:hypothetical protein